MFLTRPTNVLLRISHQDLKPHLIRLFPSTRNRIQSLPAKRFQLVAELRTFVKKFGPTLGDLYFDKTVDWHKVQTALKSLDNFSYDSQIDRKSIDTVDSNEDKKSM